jgi:hypothetical protein
LPGVLGDARIVIELAHRLEESALLRHIAAMRFALVCLLLLPLACAMAGPVDQAEAARRAEAVLRDRFGGAFADPRHAVRHRVEARGKYWVVSFWDPASNTMGGGGTAWVDRATGKVDAAGAGQ